MLRLDLLCCHSNIPVHTIAVYEDWDLQKSLDFLKEQGVAVKDSLSLADAQKLVAERADQAATVSKSPSVARISLTWQWGAATAGKAQAHYEAISDSLLQTYVPFPVPTE